MSWEPRGDQLGWNRVCGGEERVLWMERAAGGQRLRESNEHKDGGLAGREGGGWRQGGHSKLE